MKKRNLVKDRVAIVGTGETRYSRDSQRTELSLALEACKKAIEDAGIKKNEIDGICGYGQGSVISNGSSSLILQTALGIPRISWNSNAFLGRQMPEAAYAVASGACDTALVVQSQIRPVMMSQAASVDLFRSRAGGIAPEVRDFAQRWSLDERGNYLYIELYSALAARMMHDFKLPREVFGLFAVNNRQNASRNENAMLRSPITLKDYMDARLVREPLGVLDMDIPGDGADALVITTAERARDLKKKPVYIHATTFGQAGYGAQAYDGFHDDYMNAMSPSIVMEALWDRSDLGLRDIDLFWPYDGFTSTAAFWTIASGWCKPGELHDFLRQNWDKDENRLKVNGRTRFSVNGGNLSFGRSMGSHFFHEAVLQLRGEAGARQVPGAKTALMAIGNFYSCADSTLLRAD